MIRLNMTYLLTIFLVLSCQLNNNVKELPADVIVHTTDSIIAQPVKNDKGVTPIIETPNGPKENQGEKKPTSPSEEDGTKPGINTKPAVERVVHYAESVDTEETAILSDTPQVIVPVDTVHLDEPDIQTKPPDHAIYDRLLQKYVSNAGKVDYRGLKSETGKLDDYLGILKNAEISKAWTSNDKLAFWINAYNAFTIKLILDNYPVSSIMDIHKGKAWDVRWIEIDGQKLSLNQIENEIIRPRFNDPRIHFAVNCAAISCPPLHNKAFVAETLDVDLDRLTKTFINDENFNIIGEKKVQLSKIFQWYAADFGDLSEFLKKYVDTPLTDKVKISFISYDWALNGQ